MYVNGSKYGVESGSELIPDLDPEKRKEVEKLEIGESYMYTTDNFKTSWEIERIV